MYMNVIAKQLNLNDSTWQSAVQSAYFLYATLTVVKFTIHIEYSMYNCAVLYNKVLVIGFYRLLLSLANIKAPFTYT